MRKFLETVLGVLLLGGLPAQPYVRSTTQGGAVMHRTDSSRIQFLVSESLAPGMINAAGQPMITRDSDPRAALESAMALGATCLPPPCTLPPWQLLEPLTTHRTEVM
jgi:hypothetical protein